MVGHAIRAGCSCNWQEKCDRTVKAGQVRLQRQQVAPHHALAQKGHTLNTSWFSWGRL